MPRDVLEINLDQVGLVCNTEARDTQDQISIQQRNSLRQVIDRKEHYCIYSKNVDPMAPKGRLTSIKDKGSALTYGAGTTISENMTNSAEIVRPDGKRTLILESDNASAKRAIKYIENFYGDESAVVGTPTEFPTLTSVSADYFMKCAEVNNQEVHIGQGKGAVPKWVGYIESGGVFNGKITRVTGTGKLDIRADVSNITNTSSKNIYIKVTKSASATAVAGATWAFNSDNQVLVTSTAHGLTSNDYVVGVSGYFDIKNPTDPNYVTNIYLTGTHQVTVIDANTFTIPVFLLGNDELAGGLDSTFVYLKNVTAGDRWQWKDGSGGTYSAQATIVAQQWLDTIYGLKIMFDSSIGHTDGDEFYITIAPISTSILAYDATLKNTELSFQAVSHRYYNIVVNEGGYFKSKKRYWYGYALQYDNYQYSPIQYSISTAFSPTTSSCNTLEVTLKLTIPTNKRITGIAIFVSETGLDDYRPNEFFFLDLHSVNSCKYIANGSDVDIVVTDSGLRGQTYDAYCNFNQDLESSTPYYGLSTQLNGHHYIAQCTVKELPLAGNMMFKSKLGCFDMFDWSKDFINLGFYPLAIKAFAGKLWVFTTNKILKINPDLFIEETLDGVGIIEGLKPLVCSAGMFWYDRNSIYMHTGSELIDIGYPIRTTPYTFTGAVSFSSTLANSYGDYLYTLYSAEKRSILFSFYEYVHDVGNYYYAWVYSLEKQEWYFWEIFLSSPIATSYYMFAGKSGEIYINVFDSVDFPIYRLYASSNSYKALDFITKKYDAGQQEQEKKFYKVLTSGQSVTVKYGVDLADSAAPNASLTSQALASNDRKKKNIQVRVTGSAGTTQPYLDTMEIIYRQLLGYR